MAIGTVAGSRRVRESVAQVLPLVCTRLRDMSLFVNKVTGCTHIQHIIDVLVLVEFAFQSFDAEHK